jgi:hypothetical protein
MAKVSNAFDSLVFSLDNTLLIIYNYIIAR